MSETLGVIEPAVEAVLEQLSRGDAVRLANDAEVESIPHSTA